MKQRLWLSAAILVYMYAGMQPVMGQDTLLTISPQPLTLDSRPLSDWQSVFVQLSSVDEMESEGWQEAFDVLSELEQNPVNINYATREDLQRIPFLTDQQIEDIQAYVYQYGGMQTLSELYMIESLDRPRALLLMHFVYAETEEKKSFPTLKNIIRYGKHQVTADGNIPFYSRKGDDNGYLGYRYRHTLRYDFHYSEFIKVGFLGAQDAGEPFFAGRNNTGYDHYSFYAVVRRLGRLKTLAVGRYKLRTGMGLILNNDFGFGKTMMLSSLGRTPTTIRAYTSRSAAKYLQGTAAMVTLFRDIDFTAFYSQRNIDATLNKDGTIATIRTDGYHRTEAEMEKKNNASQKVYGGNLHWSHGRFHVGVTALATKFNRPLQPNISQKYRLYYPAGDSFWNASVDYGYTSRRLSFSGETATGDSHALATINMISLQPNSQLQVTALHRFYSYRFTSLLGESFEEGGSVQNENGFYLGVVWRPVRNLQINAYADYAYFPWKKYLVDDASHAWDCYIATAYTHSHYIVGGSYRYKIKQKNNAKKNGLIDDCTHRARLFLSWSNSNISLKTQGDIAVNSFKQRSRGWMISQNASYQWRKWLQVSAQIGYFHTDDYASRIYTYERGLLYSFLFPANYGEGIRYGLFAKATIKPAILVIAKLTTTDYFDRDHISSGLQQIDGSSKTDLELQLCWKF